jgi:predicted deacylase
MTALGEQIVWLAAGPDGRRDGVISAPGQDVPIVELRGAAPGPTLGLVAGVHGDEVECIDALAGWLSGVRLQRGRVLAIPVAHPVALAAGTRLGPDGADLNRLFPGDPSGGQTERLADTLARVVFPSLDALLTLHSWSRSGDTATYVEYPAGTGEVERRSRELAHAVGAAFAEAWDWPAGLLPAAAVRAGIPSAELEVGGLGRATSAGRRDAMRALDGAARFAGLIDGAPARATAPAAAPAEVRRHWLEARAAGRAAQRVERGAAVRAGEVVAEVHDLHGHPVDELIAPADGVLAIHVTYGRVEPGDPVAVVFEREGGEDGAADGDGRDG